MGYVRVNKPARTTNIRPERDGVQIRSTCPVHPVGDDDEHVETLGYDDRDGTYLQRCTFTGHTWWIREKAS